MYVECERVCICNAGASRYDCVNAHAHLCYALIHQTDLTAFVDMKNVECLNQVQDHGIRGVFQAASGTAYVESDCDEQLMITVPFTQNVKVP